ncbi:MAG: beta-ketoacyl synthase N-terminal-like domain-containing protein, partial [Acidobacteriota bacterium]
MAERDRRVAVTGMGIVSAIGCDLESVWQSLMAKRTGIARIASFDASDNKVDLGAEIDDEELQPRLAARKIRKKDRMVALGLEATGQALEQAGLVGEPPYDPQEIATLMGSGVGSANSLDEGYQRFAARGARGMRPTSVPTYMANSLSASISLHYRLTGTNQVIVTACTSATNAIGQAFRQIRD